MAKQPIKKIGDYEIIEKIGQGAMGAVYKARQQSLDRIVALKILPPEIAADGQFIERFRREARTSAQLNHPNIIQGIDVGQDEASGLWYFAMEFVEGASLQAILIAQRTLEEDRVLRIGLDVARALACAERSGIVHRDIKPDNILISKEGATKLADLGLAKRTSQESEDASLTQSGKAVGTPFYMSPEQVRGENDKIDIRTDIYALGATLFHLITGRTPYEGGNATVIMTQHLTSKTPLAHKVNPHVSEPTSRLIASMMAKEREKRPASAEILVQKLEALQNRSREAARSGFVGRRTGRHGTTGPLAPIRDAATAQRTAIKPGPGGSQTTIVLGAIGGLLVLGMAVFMLGGNSKPPSRKAQEPIVREQQTPPSVQEPLAKVSETKAAALQDPKAGKASKDYEALIKFEGVAENDLLRRVDLINAFLAEHGDSAPAGRARTLLADYQARQRSEPAPPFILQPEVPRSEEPAVVAKEAPPKQHTPPPQAIPGDQPDTPERIYESIKGVLAKLEPLLKKNLFEDALRELKRAPARDLPPAAAQAIQQEQADLKALWEMRKAALGALAKRRGEEVKIKKGQTAFSGKVSADSSAEGLTLKIANGPELTLSAQQLHVEDVVAYAPVENPAGWESIRLQGLAFLAAGDLKAAKEFLCKAKEAGADKAVDLPLYRLLVIELGEQEALALGVWDRAEALFAAKSLKEAKPVYEAFRDQYGATQLHAKNQDLLASRLEAIEFAFKPKFSFRPDESMKMFDAGARFNTFPVMEQVDPLAPFSGKPAYFNQKTGTAVVYEIHSPTPLSSLRWKGAAMQNMTIGIEDMNGKPIKKGGPYNGGNKWAEFNLDFPPQEHFLLRLENHISHWYFVMELEFK